MCAFPAGFTTAGAGGGDIGGGCFFSFCFSVFFAHLEPFGGMRIAMKQGRCVPFGRRPSLVESGTPFSSEPVFPDKRRSLILPFSLDKSASSASRRLLSLVTATYAPNPHAATTLIMTAGTKGEARLMGTKNVIAVHALAYF